MWVKHEPIPTLMDHSCHRENMSIFQGIFNGEKKRLWYQEMWQFVYYQPNYYQPITYAVTKLVF